MKKNSTLLFAILAISCTGLFAQSTFINEINYLSTNPLKKGIEVAGPAGQNLNGWLLAVYDGNGSMSSSRQLGSRVIPNQDNGHGAVWFEMEQLSGTSGFALINPVNDVVQFVGVGLGAISGITAVDGPAQGMTATYAGSQLLPNNSLQLTGIGLDYLDFVWAIPLGTTPGDVNTGQIFGLVGNILRGIGGLFRLPQETPMPGLNPLQHTTALNSGLEINVFPNPAANYVRLQKTASDRLSGGIPVVLLDVSGKVLQQAILAGEDAYLELDLSGLAGGSYLIRYGEGADAIVRRIIKR